VNFGDIFKFLFCYLGVLLTAAGMSAGSYLALNGKPLAGMAAIAMSACWLPIFLLGRHHASLRRK
jgi:hypothetical protein